MKQRRFVLLSFALMGFLPGLVLASFAGLPPLQLQGSDKSPDTHLLILTFQYRYPLNRKPGDLTFQWQTWHCKPGKKDIAPSNGPYDESPFPGSGCTSRVRMVDKPIDVSSWSEATMVDVRGTPGIWYVRARLSSRRDGVGPWGSWHRTEVWVPKKDVLLVRPQIWPSEGAEIIGKDVDLAISSGTRRSDSQNWDYQLDWQRAKVVTRFNDTYVRNHTPPGKIPEGAWPGMRRPWLDPMRPTTVEGFATTMSAYLNFDTARPRSHKFGYQYWVRAREHDLPTNSYSRWSAWASFTVQELTTTKLTARGSLSHVNVFPVVKPPIVQTPRQNRIFVNQGVDVKVSNSPLMRHTDYSRWEYVFEWKRADYHTKANNTYSKQKWEKWKRTSHSNEGYFPPVSGLDSELKPWLSPTRLRTKPENSGTTGGFQVLGSKRPTMNAHLNFSSLRSKRMDSSYLYQFRVREHLRNSNTYGPWSAWRSFIVQEPYQVNVRPFMGSLGQKQFGQKQGKQQSGQQQSRRFTPMAPVRRLNRPVRRLPKGKPTAGPRHAMQQRGVQKKLTPATPALRFAPAAPVRRLNLPARRLPKGKPTAGPRHATQQRGVRKKLTPVTPALRFSPAAPVRRLNLPARPGLNR